MPTKILFVLLLCFSVLCQAQMISKENYSELTTGGITRYNNYQIVGNKIVEKLDYAEVSGKCFWSDEWKPALLILNKNSAIKLNKVKVNLYNNTVHFINSEGQVLESQGKINKVILFDQKDTTRIVALFQNLPGLDPNVVESLGQVLNQGNTQLIKKELVTIGKTEIDPVTRASHERFKSTINYALLKDGKISPLKGLNKASILSSIKASPEDEQWLTSSKNKLKNEASVIAYLDYLNNPPKK